MQAIVDGCLESTRVGEGREFGGMALFPLFREGESPLRYLVLAEAISGGAVEVRERAAASVPELWLVNRSGSMVLVMDGEEIVGGKQNRMANASFLIAAHSEVLLPVTCVEHGRWHDVAPRFSPGEAAPSFLRREKEIQVRESLRTGARHAADQGAVWDSIAARQVEECVSSPTGALNDIYVRKTESLAAYERAFAYPEGAVGMAVALNERMVGADLFDQPSTAGKLWSKLVRSYAMDADPGRAAPPVSSARAERLLRRLVGARTEVYPSIALGWDVRLEGERATGSALVHEGIVVHLGIFRIHGQGTGSGSTGMARASRRWRLQAHREDG